MTSWQKIFDFRRAPYLRPNETWICGRTGLGATCTLGPGAVGNCRTRKECDPIFSQGGWACTRGAEVGGKCDEGPSKDGVCCRAIPKCVPVRTMRSLRGRVSFWMFVVTLLGLVGTLGTDLRFKFFDPGPVIQGHSGVSGCGSCHTVGKAHVGDWFKAAWSHRDPTAGSAKCLTCHDRGQNAMRPHSLPQPRLSAYTDKIAAPAGGFGDLSTHLANGTIFPTHESAEETLPCATCHKDHKGLNFDPNVVSDGRCQTCHKQKFASLDDGHPSFGDYPYVRRSRLAFDHNKHFKRHFNQAKGASAPAKCANCHEPDPTGRYMVVKPFELTCGTCHTKDIEGIGLAGSKGIPVFSVPGLDTETLKARGFNIGQWPEDADSDGISPFIKVLLAADPVLDNDLQKLATIDLQELSTANKSVLAAVHRVAWGFKELLYELGRHGGEAVQVRIANGFGMALDREAVGRLVGNLPRDVIRAAQARWYPKLAREISRYRKRRAELIWDNPTTYAGLFGGLALWPEQPIQMALATPLDDQSLWTPEFEPHGQRILLAQTGDLLNGNSKLIDKPSLRLKEYRDLKREDRGANNSLFKKGGTRRSNAPAKASRKARKKVPNNATNRNPSKKKKTNTRKPKPTPVVKRTTEKKKRPVTKPKSKSKLRAKRRDFPRPAPALQQPRLQTKLGPLPDPEQWARSGGWYRVDFTLFYRRAEHKDAFMKSWLDVAAETHGGPAERYGQALLSTFRDSNTVGKCIRCHSVDRVSTGKLLVNWKPFAPNPDEQKFTVFDHATHFSMAGEKGCQSCHRLNPKAKFARAYRGLDPTSFESNFFAPIKRETCAECHVPESAGNECVQCHRYHVGEFVSAPIATGIANRQVSITRFGTAPSGTARADQSQRANQSVLPPKADKPARPKSKKFSAPTKISARKKTTRRRSPPAVAIPVPKPKRTVASGRAKIRQVPIPKHKPPVPRSKTRRPKPSGLRVSTTKPTYKVANIVGEYAVRLSSYWNKETAQNRLRRLQRTVIDHLDGQELWPNLVFEHLN